MNYKTAYDSPPRKMITNCIVSTQQHKRVHLQTINTNQCKMRHLGTRFLNYSILLKIFRSF